VRITCLLVVCLSLASGLSAAGEGGARKAFQRGVKAESAGQARAAYEAFADAARLDPKNIQYITRREMARQRAAFRLVSEGLRWMNQGEDAKALEALNAAVELDPANDFSRHQRDVVAARLQPQANPVVDLPPPPPELTGEPVIALEPRPIRQSWHLRGDTRALYLALGAAYRIRFEFDDEIRPVTARLELSDADFAQALRAVGLITGTFAAPLSSTEALVAPDTNVKRLALERQMVQQLDCGQFTTPEAINEVANLLRTLLEIPQITVNLARRLISVRGPASKVLAAERIVKSLNLGRSEVYLELQSVEVSASKARELGLLPSLSTSASKLSRTGTLESGVSVPLRQIIGDAAPTGSGAASPLGTFGGGRTMFGVTVPSATLKASFSETMLRSLTTAQMRASDGTSTTYLFGVRYPIVLASFSPILLSGDALQQQQQGTLVNPFPAFTFEDLGFKVKATARVHLDEVTLALEIASRALSGRTLNGVPGISNRELQTQVRVRDGETVILSGLLDRQESRSFGSVPGLGALPGVGLLFGDDIRERSDTEVLLLLTPHIVRLGPTQSESPRPIPAPADYVPVRRTAAGPSR
jgi:general secretion pathway protein D